MQEQCLGADVDVFPSVVNSVAMYIRLYVFPVVNVYWCLSPSWCEYNVVWFRRGCFFFFFLCGEYCSLVYSVVYVLLNVYWRLAPSSCEHKLNASRQINSYLIFFFHFLLDNIKATCVDLNF